MEINVLKFADRFQKLSEVKFVKTGGSGLFAIDFPPLPIGSIWVVDSFNRISDIACSTSAFFAMPPETQDRFPGLSPALLAADIFALVLNGIQLRARDASNVGSDEVPVGATQVEYYFGTNLAIIQGGWFVRFIAQIGGVTQQIKLSIWGFSLNRNELCR